MMSVRPGSIALTALHIAAAVPGLHNLRSFTSYSHAYSCMALSYEQDGGGKSSDQMEGPTISVIAERVSQAL